MQIPKSCDIVVIGGGPAGSVAATMLAQKGWRVVLFEKQRHPRYTVGESLIPDFWKYLDLIGVSEKIMAAGFIQKSGGMVNWQGEPQAHTFKAFGYTRPALHVERDRFDEILLRHAQEEGVLVYEEVKVSEAEVGKQPVELHYRDLNSQNQGRITAQYVIDASGQNAVIGQQLKLRKFDDAFRFMSVWGYFTGAKYLSIDGVAYNHEEIKRKPPVTYVTSLDGGDAGWCWYIALCDSTSVGLVFPNENMKELKPSAESWESYFVRRCYDIPVVGQLLAEATFSSDSVRLTRDYSYQSSQLAGPGFYLIGDAAGFVDPIFSVGIVLSIYSAYLAAWAVDGSLKNPALVDVNQALFEKQLRGRFEIARSLALPRYQPASQVSEEAKVAIALEATNVKKMMQTVSSLTKRSDNFKAMIDGSEAFDLTDDQLRSVDNLKLS